MYVKMSYKFSNIIFNEKVDFPLIIRENYNRQQKLEEINFTSVLFLEMGENSLLHLFFWMFVLTWQYVGRKKDTNGKYDRIILGHCGHADMKIGISWSKFDQNIKNIVTIANFEKLPCKKYRVSYNAMGVNDL